MKHFFYTLIAAFVAAFAFVSSASAMYPADDAGQAASKENSATSPVAVGAVTPMLRAADPDSERADRYGLPYEVSALCADKSVVMFNVLSVAGKARQELTRLSEGKPLELIDVEILPSMIQAGLERASKEWERITGQKCPVTMEYLTRPNQEAAAIVCCAGLWEMNWSKTMARFNGKVVKDGVSLKAKAFETPAGKAAFVVSLNGHSELVVIEDVESDLENALKVAQSGNDRDVVIPSFSYEAENDFEERYPEYFGSDCLRFSDDRPLARLGSFKENIAFSLDENGVRGVSVVSMTAFSKGIFIPREPEKDAIFIDEPFRGFVVSKLVDGTSAVIFDVTVNTLK